MLLRGFFVICFVQPDFSGFRIADGYGLGVRWSAAVVRHALGFYWSCVLAPLAIT